MDDRAFIDDGQVFYKLVERDIPENARILVRPVSPGSKFADNRRMVCLFSIDRVYLFCGIHISLISRL